MSTTVSAPPPQPVCCSTLAFKSLNVGRGGAQGFWNIRTYLSFKDFLVNTLDHTSISK